MNKFQSKQKAKDPPRPQLENVLHRASTLGKGVGLLVELTRIKPRSHQPRVHFDQQALTSLADNIKQQGILEPLIVRPLEDGYEGYEIVAGERRWRAAGLAGLEEVPVIVKPLSDGEADLVAAIENLQRQDLDRFDEVSYKLKLISAELQVPQEDLVGVLKEMRAQPGAHPEEVERLEQLFSSLGRESWTSFVTNGLPVLKLPQHLLRLVRAGQLQHTKAVLIARTPRIHHDALITTAQSEQLTVEQLRRRIASLTKTQSGSGVDVQSLRKALTPAALQRLERQNPKKHQRARQLIAELHTLLGEPEEKIRKDL